MWHFDYFSFERNYDVLNAKSPCVLLNKNVSLIKTERNQKWKTPHTVLQRRTLCFGSYNNRKLKVKLWWVGVPERKERTFFVPFLLSEKNFFKICVLSQFIESWMQFQNIHTFIYQKILLHTLLLLVFKIVEYLQCNLKQILWRWRSSISKKSKKFGNYREELWNIFSTDYNGATGTWSAA